MTNEMKLVVDAGVDVRCIYDEALDLREIGKLQITRASHVERDAEGDWWVGPSGGPLLGPFRSRTEALGAERGWLAGQIVETASNQRLPGTAADTSALLAAFEANRCRSGLAYR
jgi:hypothetical protein